MKFVLSAYSHGAASKGSRPVTSTLQNGHFLLYKRSKRCQTGTSITNSVFYLLVEHVSLDLNPNICWGLIEGGKSLVGANVIVNK